MTNGTKAGLVGLAWFLIGGGLGGVSSTMMALVAMGGQQEPPGFWAVALIIGMFAGPILLAFGGIPVAHRVSKGLPAQKLAGQILGATFVLLAICWTVVLIWRPAY